MGELTRQINDLFLPQISKAQGFVSYYAVDASSGTLATASDFESQSGAENYRQQGGGTFTTISDCVKRGKATKAESGHWRGGELRSGKEPSRARN